MRNLPIGFFLLCDRERVWTGKEINRRDLPCYYTFYRSHPSILCSIRHCKRPSKLVLRKDLCIEDDNFEIVSLNVTKTRELRSRWKISSKDTLRTKKRIHPIYRLFSRRVGVRVNSDLRCAPVRRRMAARWAQSVALIGLSVQLLSHFSRSVNCCDRFVICGSGQHRRSEALLSVEAVYTDFFEAKSFSIIN